VIVRSCLIKSYIAWPLLSSHTSIRRRLARSRAKLTRKICCCKEKQKRHLGIVYRTERWKINEWIGNVRRQEHLRKHCTGICEAIAGHLRPSPPSLSYGSTEQLLFCIKKPRLSITVRELWCVVRKIWCVVTAA
jgi:hypothetical protein